MGYEVIATRCLVPKRQSRTGNNFGSDGPDHGF